VGGWGASGTPGLVGGGLVVGDGGLAGGWGLVLVGGWGVVGEG
jgi:hypothetical protein